MSQSLKRKPLLIPRQLIRSGIMITIVFGSLLGCSLIDNFVNPELNPITTPTSVSSAEATSSPMCFWNWATNNAKPEHIDALTESLDSAAVENYEVLASAYGEDKICMVDDEVVSSTFHMMDISPTITLRVDTLTLSDTITLSDSIRTIMIALESNDSLPNINRLEILFTDDTDTVRWLANYIQVKQAIDNDIRDDDLFAIGQG